MNTQTRSLLSLLCLFSAVLITTGTLSGCTGMMRQLGFEPIQQTASAECANAQVLVTNLNEQSTTRQYQTIDGKNCPEVNYYESDKKHAAQAEQEN